MKLSAALIVIGALGLSAQPVLAAGCLKGAVVGGVAGHFAHHHTVLGAVAGCAIGHHMAAKKEREEKARQEQMQAQQHGASGHY